MKKLIALLLSILMVLGVFAGCASQSAPAPAESAKTEETKTEETKTEEAAPAEETEASTEETGNVHIGIVTGSVSQSEDDRRGAEAFQQLYGEENVTLVTYPDNFTEELETTIQCMSSKITSAISVQLMPLYKSPHITKGLSSAAVLTGRGGNVTISTSKSLGEKNRWHLIN